ncbi:MAG: putative rane protein [Gaiellaceae bacterium]|nr:putative rane protein [Gaiellaceae bacterium]
MPCLAAGGNGQNHRVLVAHATWSAPPLVVSAAVLAAVLFARGWLRLRARGRTDHASWGRVALFAAGLGAALAGLMTPIDSLGEHELLSMHMLQHVLIGDISPALMIAAVRGPLLVFLVPAPVLAPIARDRVVRGALGALLRPRVAFGLWATNLALWHIPSFYDAALRHSTLHDFEHSCWVLAGLLVWTLLIDPGSHRRLTTGGRLALAAALFACGQVLTDVLVFSFRPLYPYYLGAFGLSPVTDQQLAGVVMMVDQLLTLSVLVFFLLRSRVRRSARLVTA